jgi:hypothetical protein
VIRTHLQALVIRGPSRHDGVVVFVGPKIAAFLTLTLQLLLSLCVGEPQTKFTPFWTTNLDCLKAIENVLSHVAGLEANEVC